MTRKIFQIIWNALLTKIPLTLCIIATVNLPIGFYLEGWSHGWIDGLAIYLALPILIGFTVAKNHSLEKLREKQISRPNLEYCAVVRGQEGASMTVTTTQLVVGDVIKIEQGMKIPADCILLEGFDVATDESSFTGEPEQKEKKPLTAENYAENVDPFLLGQTLVCQGQGTAMVCCVGAHSRFGQAAQNL